MPPLMLSKPGQRPVLVDVTLLSELKAQAAAQLHIPVHRQVFRVDDKVMSFTVGDEPRSLEELGLRHGAFVEVGLRTKKELKVSVNLLTRSAVVTLMVPSTGTVQQLKEWIIAHTALTIPPAELALWLRETPLVPSRMIGTYDLSVGEGATVFDCRAVDVTVRDTLRDTSMQLTVPFGVLLLTVKHMIAKRLGEWQRAAMSDVRCVNAQLPSSSHPHLTASRSTPHLSTLQRASSSSLWSLSLPLSLLVVGCWLLVVGCWLLVVGC
jgi:hypothetical protein